jgi:lysozyme family protein
MAAGEIFGWRDDPVYCAAVQTVIQHEGGLNMDPRDKGNWTGGEVGRGECKGTKYGISAASYPGLDIENLTIDDASMIYYRDWWLKYEYSKLPPGLATKLLDCAIMAPRPAHRSLQRAIRAAGSHQFIPEDGFIGVLTLEASHQVDQAACLAAFKSEFAGYLRLLAAHYQAVHGRPDPDFHGWLNRAYA